MEIAVIIPVGPGHQEVANEAVDSVMNAERNPNWSIRPYLVPDVRGELGRSRARNIGVQAALSEAPCDWLMFLDADDVAFEGVFRALEVAAYTDPALEAIWGELWNEFGLYSNDKPKKLLQLRCERSDGCTAPMETWDALVEHGPFASIHVGHFVKPALFSLVGGWCEFWDLGEDIEFNWACAAHAKRFIKLARRLVKVRNSKASAHGSRGYGKLKPGNMAARDIWQARCSLVHRYWKERGHFQWTTEERDRRLLGTLYGPNEFKWQDEPV